MSFHRPKTPHWSATGILNRGASQPGPTGSVQASPRGTKNRSVLPPGPLLIWDNSGWLSSQSQVPTQFKHLGLFRECTASISSKLLIRAAGGGTLELAIAMMECKHLNSIPHDGGDWLEPCYIFGDRQAIAPEVLGQNSFDPTSRSAGRKIAGFRPSDIPITKNNTIVFGKTGYAANFGLFKMNWYMISQTPAAKNQIGNRNPEDESVWREVGTTINGSPMLATQILIEATRGGYQSNSAPPWDMSMPGGNIDNFWAGQRWGQSGLHNHDYGIEPDRMKSARLPAETWDDIRKYYQKVKYVQWMCNQDPNVWNSPVRYGSALKNI